MSTRSTGTRKTTSSKPNGFLTSAWALSRMETSTLSNRVCYRSRSDKKVSQTVQKTRRRRLTCLEEESERDCSDANRGRLRMSAILSGDASEIDGCILEVENEMEYLEKSV